MKRFVVVPCTGNKLEELLNDKWAEGYEPVESTLAPVGAKEVQNRLMPGQTTVMPLHNVVFRPRLKVVNA